MRDTQAVCVLVAAIREKIIIKNPDFANTATPMAPAGLEAVSSNLEFTCLYASLYGVSFERSKKIISLHHTGTYIERHSKEACACLKKKPEFLHPHVEGAPIVVGVARRIFGIFGIFVLNILYQP